MAQELQKKVKLSIIIPSYNEEKTILEILRRVKNQPVPGVEKEIIVVDDGSTDASPKLLRETNGIVLITHEKNRGKGAAIRTGLKRASGEIIIIQDADLELSPEDYPALTKPILDGKTDVVYGSRLLGRMHPKHDVFFYSGGKLVTFAANFLYNIRITDEPIGYKVFRSEILKSLNLRCERFEFCPEVTAKIAKRKIKIYEVPVQYHPRTTKEGKKLRVRDGVEAIWTLFKYKFMD